MVLGGSEADMGLSVTPGLSVCKLAMRAEDVPLGVATAMAALRRIGMASVLVGQRPVLGKRVAKTGRAALHRLAQQRVPVERLQAALHAFAATGSNAGANLATDALPKPADPRLWSSVAIQRRWLAAQANKALQLLDEGMALRPSDVDHLSVSLHGFPRWRGGTMHQADRRGLLILRHDLRHWATQDAFWTPATLFGPAYRRGPAPCRSRPAPLAKCDARDD